MQRGDGGAVSARKVEGFMAKKGAVVVATQIEQSIYLIRGQKVMLDRDLAVLYGVETKQLKQAVRRNIERFPDDFMFELSKDDGALEVTNCDLQKRQDGPEICAHGLYRAGSGHVIQCS
jgi:hypothetical protein